jgi:hypothetical protein
VHPIERLRAVARARDVDQRLLAREAALVLGVLADDPFGLVTSCRRLLDRHPGAGALWWACARLLDAADTRSEARAVARDLDDGDAVLRALSLDLPEHSTVVVIPDAAGGSELVDQLAVRRDDLVPVEAEDPALDVAAVLDAGAGAASSAEADTGVGLDAGFGLGGDLEDIEDLAPDLDAGLAAAAAAAAAGDVDPFTRPPLAPGSGPTIVLVEAGAADAERFLGVAGTAEGIAAARARGLPVWLVVGAGSRLPGPLFEAAVARASECEVVPAASTDRVVERRTPPCPCPPELLRPWSQA